jgi:Cu(I)/Ag(I) efflux system protein CusF
MKSLVIAGAFALASGASLAQAGDMKGMDMKDDMKGTDMKPSSKPTKGPHKAVGVVKKIDTKAATVTIAHEPVKSMNWPAMNMTFQVQDKSMLDKLAEGKKVEVEFEQRGQDYVITSAK